MNLSTSITTGTFVAIVVSVGAVAGELARVPTGFLPFDIPEMGADEPTHKSLAWRKGSHPCAC